MDIGTIGALIILLIVAVALFFSIKKHKDDQAAEDFIVGLSDKIVKITLETINDMDPEKFTDFEQFSGILINKIYDAVWDYVSYTAQEAVEINEITKTVFKLIDKDTVVDLINKLFEENGIYDQIYNRFAAPKIQNLEENQEPEEVYDSEEYFTEEVVNPEDLPLAGEKQYNEQELEEISKLIPPTDEENEFVDLEDDSVEILVDKKEIISQKAKNGQIRYYEIDKDGRKTRVTKEYATRQMEV